MTINSMENNTQELILERIKAIRAGLQQHDASLLEVDLVPLAQSGALDFRMIKKWEPVALRDWDLNFLGFTPEQRDRFEKLLLTETDDDVEYMIEYEVKNGKLWTSGDKSNNGKCTELYRRSTRTWITEFALPNGKKQRIARTLQNELLEIVLEDEDGVKMQLLYQSFEDDDSDEEDTFMGFVRRNKPSDETITFLSGALAMLTFLLIMYIYFRYVLFRISVLKNAYALDEYTDELSEL